MPKSLDQLMSESNARSQRLNAENIGKGNLGVSYYLSKKTPTGGTESYRDPAFSMSNPAYAAKRMAGFARPTEAGSTMWSSDEPTSAFYSPTGSDWRSINEGMLSDPAVAQAVMKGAVGGGPSAGAFSALKAKIPTGVTQGIEGSQHALSSDVLSKMWR
jgi:hypothetical protein